MPSAGYFRFLSGHPGNHHHCSFWTTASSFHIHIRGLWKAPDNSDGEQIPVLYSIHHCYYDRYPYDADVLNLSDETINVMKEAYRQMRIAEIYATRVDRMMSGDDGEEGLQERLSADLEAFGKEFQAKDWTCSYEDDED